MISDTENDKKLKTFFNDEYHSLKAYVRLRINDASDRDAGDIVQDVALKLFSRPHTASAIHNIAGFVYNSIRNRIIDVMRTKKDQIHIENDMETRLVEFTEFFYGESDNGYSENMKRQLKKAIINLKPVYRNIITAIDFEGFTYRELSLETGVPEGTLMSQRHRAIALLFKELETKKETTN